MPNISLPIIPPAKTEYDPDQLTQNIDDIIRTLQQLRDVISVVSTGWTAPTGTASKAGYNTATATTTQLAQTLKAVVDHLIAKGDFEI